MKIKSLLMAILILIISFLPLTGCSSNSKIQKRDSIYVEDSEWFNNVHFETKFYENCFVSQGYPLINFSDDELIMYERFSGYDNKNDVIASYKLGADGSCTLQGSIDLLETGLSYENEETDEYKGVSFCYEVGEYLYAVVSEMYVDEEGNYQKDGYIQVIDVKNSTLLEEIRNPNIDNFIEQGFSSKMWFREDRIYTINSISYDIYNSEYSIIELDSEFNIISSTAIEGIDSSEYFSDFYVLDNNHAIGVVSNFNLNTNIIYDVDLENFEATIIENPPEELLVNGWKMDCVNGRLVLSDAFGLWEYDYDSNTVKEIFNYNDCNVVRSEVDKFEVVYVDDDTICAYSIVGGDGLGYRFWRFTRAESNPNVGKELIRIADLDGKIDENVAQAVYEFNETSDSVFIVFDDRYVLENYIEADSSMLGSWEFESSEEYKTLSRNAQSILSNQLRVDIISGDGPDLILDAYGHSELNSGECFVDLKNELISGGYINPDEYLPYVFGHAENVYQIPLSVSVRGLLWFMPPEDNVRDSYGLTYDEYLAYVDEVCNGDDPISGICDKNEYFLELFNNSFATFIHDGTIDINNEAFRSLAEFVNGRSDICTFDPNLYTPIEMARYCGSSVLEIGIDPTFLREYVPSALPSFDGSSSFRYKVVSSVGVVSTCPQLDEVLSLVCSIMDNFSDSISTDGVYNWAQNKVERAMQTVINHPDYFDIPESAMLTGEEADVYLEIVTASTELVYEDSDINVILYEEIQAYFAGDKTLDEIIPIIEDRVSTVLNERG